MFGKNPIRKLERESLDGKLAVQDIFYTLQGEGPCSGMPAVFIRLAGCHLACTFCDTEFESGIDYRLDVPEILRRVHALVAGLDITPMIVLTGGEPMRQPLATLCNALDGAGFNLLQIETAGSFWEPALEPLIIRGHLVVVISPKTSHVHSVLAHHARHWKYVVRAGDESLEDGLPVKPTQAGQETGPALARPWDYDGFPVVWISPCDEHDEAKTAANMIHAAGVCMRNGYRLSLQIHKLLNLP